MAELRPKILFVATEYILGMRPYALSIIRQTLSPDDHILIVLRKEHSAYLDDFDFADKSQLHVYEYPEGKLNRIKFRLWPRGFYSLLTDLVERHGIEIVHLLTGDLILAHYIKRLTARVKVLHTVHDALPHESEHLSLAASLNERLFLNRPNRIMNRSVRYSVTNSRAQLEYIDSHFSGQKHFFAHFPTLVTPIMRSGNDNVTELSGIDNYILFFGRVEKYKGIELLIEAYRGNQQLASHPLVIAGKGEIDYNEAYPEVKGLVHLNRFIKDEELNDLFGNAAVVAYPYISATQSGVLSVASFYGRKVVLSDVAFFKEEAEGAEGFFFFKTGDVESLSAALEAALDSDSETSLLYQQRYSSAALCEELNSIYRDIIDDNG